MVDTKDIAICAIAALTKNDRVIGKNGEIPWQKPKKDMKRFVKATKGKPVIMGRKTWGSFDEAYQPLPQRPNIIVTGQDNYKAPEALVVNSPQKAVEQAQKIAEDKGVEEIFVIGGQSIYEALLPQIDKLMLTLIDADIDGDTYFPPYKNKFTKKQIEGEHEEGGLSFTFATFRRP
jgi:dihydrofolate reductase